MDHHGPFSIANCNKLPEGTLMYIASWSDGICLSDMAIDHESLMGMSHRIGGVETSHVWWHPKENIRTSPENWCLPIMALKLYMLFIYAFHMVFHPYCCWSKPPKIHRNIQLWDAQQVGNTQPGCLCLPSTSACRAFGVFKGVFSVLESLNHQNVFRIF
jgi:hypothetical protein